MTVGYMARKTNTRLRFSQLGAVTDRVQELSRPIAYDWRGDHM